MLFAVFFAFGRLLEIITLVGYPSRTINIPLELAAVMFKHTIATTITLA
jgi:hypothetical protein